MARDLTNTGLLNRARKRRILNAKLSARVLLGQPVIIENVTGQTAAWVSPGRTCSRGWLYSELRDIGNECVQWCHLCTFVQRIERFHVANPTSQPYVIIAKNELPATDLKQFIAWLKANLNKALAGTAGSGSPGHIAGAGKFRLARKLRRVIKRQRRCYRGTTAFKRTGDRCPPTGLLPRSRSSARSAKSS
jgi:hypothetical protein